MCDTFILYQMCSPPTRFEVLHMQNSATKAAAKRYWFEDWVPRSLGNELAGREILTVDR